MTMRRRRSLRLSILFVLAALFCAVLPWWRPFVVHAAAPTPPAPLPLISANLPAYTNDLNAYDPSLVDDTNYGTIWDSVDTPSSTRPIWIALDLSSVPTAKRQQVILAWFNDSGEYLPGANNVYYNLPANYTIDANAAAGGSGAAPGAGWVTLLTVTGNTRNAREHTLNLAGYNWVRMTITGIKGSSGNNGAAFNLDLYDASAGDQDNWLFLGDSITQEGMTQGDINGGPWSGGDYAQLVHAADSAYYPIQIDGGMGGWTSVDGAQNIAALMSGFSGQYVSLAFGTNDANQPYLLSTSQIETYYTNTLTMIDAVQSAGKIAVVPYVPWGCNGDLGQNAQALNNYVNAHLATDRPNVIRGPDLWTPFSQNHSWISSDCIHPTDTAPSGQLSGFEQYQRVWEQWAVGAIYAPAIAPVVQLAPTSLSFGNQNVNTTSAAQSATLTNGGNAPLTISDIALTGTSAADFSQTNTCPLSPTTLAAGANCVISVTFTPGATGMRTANVSVSDNASGSPQNVALSGTGVTPAPGVSLNPTSLNFGSQNVNTTSAAQTVTVTNTGTAPLTITSVSLTGTNATDFAQTSTCPTSPTTLAAGANCTISVTFTPTANGARGASISLSDDATGSPQSASLAGTGVTPAPGVALNPTSITFGAQLVGTTSAAQTITLTNSGTAPLTISGIALTGANTTDFAQTNTCPISPTTLAAGVSCTISVTFTPATAGARTASVSLSDDAAGSPQSVALTGTGATSSVGVALVGSAAANGNFGAGVKIKLPIVQAGDLLIAAAGTNGSPTSWTTPAGWTAGTGGGHPDGQGLNWWWKIATSADSGATITLKASAYADGGGIVLDYRGASSSPILAVSALATNDNGGNGHVTSAVVNGVSWTSSASVVSLALLSWQPTAATLTWPTGYVAQATATDGYGFIAAGANLTAQSVSSLGAQTVKFSASQAVIPTLQIAILVGP